MAPAIETERLRLRPLLQGDAVRLAGLCNDLEVSRWLARVPHPYDPEMAAAFIAETAAAPAFVRGIDAPGEGGLIGVVGVDGLPRQAQLGYWLGRAYWRRGYGTEAVRAVVGHVFAATALRKIRAGAFAANAGSRRILTKLGFHETGRRMARSGAVAGEMPHLDLVLERTAWEAVA
ncbi:GNAT family protein [Paralimibaculum aggregatum]|uniref:GNAT family protein n=1 Tax=Paralimibaculum aggregatum TaxID=3036245 RepID=A0ABQ6LHB5_9RHOB|nr:GNAT family N-acetyltransferase [Limibaculum sp. NKW23]GMG81620.1 GNAT family protein [Limibaculum sp. NKW23]